MAPVYRDAAVVVWTQDAPQAHVDYIGCSRATGRTTTVLHFDNDCISASGGCDDVRPRIRRTRRTGSWLALYADNEASNAAIELADVATGTVPRPDGYRTSDTPREMVVGRDGTLAWISATFSGVRQSRELRLCAAACRASGGQARRVATGRRLSHLRLTGGHVSWSDGDHTHSAPAR